MSKGGRKSIRLSGYDYFKPGYYFVTICVKNKENALGEIKNEHLILNNKGKVVEKSLNLIETRIINLKICTYIIMPNHVHIIFQLLHSDCRGVINHTRIDNINKGIANYQKRISGIKSLPEIIRYFKARTTRILRKDFYNYFEWQRNYYERIIRNKGELFKYKTYIKNNTKNWKNDEYFLS